MIESVLIVEDNLAHAKILGEQLAAGPRVHQRLARTVGEAIRLLAEASSDVILLDLQLPDGSSVDTLAQMLEAAPLTPIIVLTGLDEKELGTQCVQMGAQDYLVKSNVSSAMLSWAMRNAVARKQSELALQRSEANYRGLFQNSISAIAKVAPDGRISEANREFVKLLGTTQEGIRGLTLGDYLVSHDVHRIVLDPEEDLFQDIETLLRRMNGEERLVRLNGRRVTDSAELPTWIELVIEDITDRRMLEDQLRQAQKLEAVAQLAGGVAHDLNNVLAIIMAEVQSLRAAGEAPTPEEYDGQLAVVQDTTRRGADLVKHLLGYSRQRQLTFEKLDLSHVVQTTVRMARRMVPTNITLATSIAQGDHWVLADENAIETILLNLITNARDATKPDDHILVRVKAVDHPSPASAPFLGVAEGQYVCMTVEDDGVGMTDETRARAFEPFFSTKPRDVGTGLGLASVYGLVQQHHGFVAIESAEHHGTAVRILLPKTTPAAESVKKTWEPTSLGALKGSETILLVEDETHLRSAAVRSFERFGYEVVAAENGEEGLNAFVARQSSIDLVVTDVVMPQMSGLELRKRIHQINPAVPFLFVTGYSPDDVASVTNEQAPANMLEKPWEIGDLLQAVRELLAQETHAPPTD